MSTDITQVLQAQSELEVSPDAGGTERGSLPWIYWRGKNGWITYGMGWPTEVARKTRLGCTPLYTYGQFFAGGNKALPYKDSTTGEPRVLHNWRPIQDPYRYILIQGGAKEFCVEQILELGWHRKPPLPGVIFPQLALSTQVDVQCPACRRWFLSDSDRSRHESVMHKDTSQQSSLARELAAATSQYTGPLAEVLKIIVGQQATFAASLAAQQAMMAELMQRIANPKEESESLAPARARKAS